jgi:hypothetical protein
MEIKISSLSLFWFGVGISLFLLISAIISVPVEGGSNYYTTDSLLGILINHDIVALSTYILIIALILASSCDLVRKN